MGKHSKRDRSQTMRHAVLTDRSNPQIRFLKDPKTKIIREECKRSVKKELITFFSLAAFSAIGFALYSLASHAVQCMK